MSNQMRIAVSIASVLVVALIVTIFTLIYLHTGRQAVELVVVPQDAKIHTPVGNLGQGVHYLPYGQYTVTTTRDGFRSIDKTITVDSDTTKLFFSTVPDNEVGEKYLKDHPDEQYRYEVVGGAESQSTGAAVQKKYPFVDQLPLTNFKDNFTIHYGVDEKTANLAYFVIGESSTSGRQKALSWLERNGVDISTTDIRYSTFISPLKKEITIEDFR